MRCVRARYMIFHILYKRHWWRWCHAAGFTLSADATYYTACGPNMFFFSAPFTFIPYLPHFARQTLTNDACVRAPWCRLRTRVWERLGESVLYAHAWRTHCSVYIHVYMAYGSSSTVHCSSGKDFFSRSRSTPLRLSRLFLFGLGHFTTPFKWYASNRPIISTLYYIMIYPQKYIIF